MDFLRREVCRRFVGGSGDRQLGQNLLYPSREVKQEISEGAEQACTL